MKKEMRDSIIILSVAIIFIVLLSFLWQNNFFLQSEMKKSFYFSKAKVTGYLLAVFLILIVYQIKSVIKSKRSG